MEIISVKNLKKSFGSLEIIKDVSFFSFGFSAVI